eukprot:1726648-Lingulodinium_polyedra.AAC.1
MAIEESSEEDPTYWVDLLERTKGSKGGKGKYTAPYSVFLTKAPFPKMPSTAGPPWPGGKGVYE